MSWAQRQKDSGNRLELTWFDARQLWKKKYKGVVKYFKFPNSKAGYEDALKAWFKLRAELDVVRPNVEVFEHHQAIFGRIQNWYDSFGVPVAEAKLADQVSAFQKWVASWLEQVELPDRLPMGSFCQIGKRPEFWNEFGADFTLLGQQDYELPAKWIDRLDRSSNTLAKEPQTIGHWIERYVARVKERGGKFIIKKSADDRRYKLVHFSNWTDKLAHVTDITSEYIETYHSALDDEAVFEKPTKQGYFKAFRMFVRWCSHQTACDLVAPKNLDSKEFNFREQLGTGRKRQAKKKLLWTVEEFSNAIETLPMPYGCYLLLMLNCGFRHVDLANLRHVDLHLKERRIVIQRNKLNQQETAPVISYPLWPKTVDHLNKAKSKDKEFVFRNEVGGSVENSIKCWWKRNHEQHATGKRLDFIRKTGATVVARHDPNLDDMYLGEALSSTAKLSYSFVDGEPCNALDDAIGVLGSEFGFCSAPVKRVTLTQDVLDALQKAGVDVAKLGG